MKKDIKELIDMIQTYAGIANNSELRSIKYDIRCEIEEKVDRYVKPKAQHKNCIGIELEFFSKLRSYEMVKLLKKFKLLDWCSLGSDSSIRPERGHADYELRILTTERRYKSDLKQLNLFLKASGAKVNKSCGLHVHLDMRRRDFTQSKEKLKTSLPILTKFVAKHRINNQFCRLQPTFESLLYNEEPKYMAINADRSYQEHKTIEVRLHESTTDTNKIENWITLLLNIVNSKKNVPEVDEIREFKKHVRLSSSIKKYVEAAS
jgi:hypothetical protein